MNQFILNADDFGMSAEHNDAVLEGYRYGLLKSASLTANGNSFDDAISRVIPLCPDLSIGVHLNIIEGKALSADSYLLTDSSGNFNNSYISLIKKTYGKDKKIFLNQIESEFRAQIEKIIKNTQAVHIDSHVHTHAIPEIFNLTCKLAKEYKIPYVRSQAEIPYIVPDFKLLISKNFLTNIIKNILLNYFTLFNSTKIKKYKLKTNDNLIGVLYTGMMNENTVYYALKNYPQNGKLLEALIHPCLYQSQEINSRYKEFLITQNTELLHKIENLNFKITNYCSAEEQ